MMDEYTVTEPVEKYADNVPGPGPLFVFTMFNTIVLDGVIFASVIVNGKFVQRGIYRHGRRVADG